MKKKSLFLCFLCLLIALPNSVIANMNITETSTANTDINTPVENIESTNPSQPQEALPTSSDSEETRLLPESEQPVLEENSIGSPIVAIDEPVTSQIESKDTNKIQSDVLQNVLSVDKAEDELLIGDVSFTRIGGPGLDLIVGDIVKVTAEISLSNIDSYTMRLILSTENDEHKLIMRYDSIEKQYIGYFVVTQIWKGGLWTAKIQAYSEQFGYKVKEIENQTFTVSNSSWNIRDPQITNITIKNPDIKAGELFEFSADIEGIGSEIVNVYAYVGVVGYVPMEKVENNTWRGSVTIPTNVRYGSYLYIYAYDSNGNDGFNHKSFNINNSTGDYTPPTVDLETVVINPQIAAVGQEVTVTAKVTDDSSGVASVFFYVGEYYHFTKMTPHPTIADTWIGKFTVKPHDTDDETYIHFRTTDHNGNQAIVRKPFYIDNPNEKPIISDITISPPEATVGKVVTISAKVEDEDNDILYVAGYLKLQTNLQRLKNGLFSSWGSERIETIPMEYNSVSGRYEGTYTIKEYDGDALRLTVQAMDSKYNYTTDWSYNILEVFNPNGDITPPIIEYVKVSSEKANPNDLVHFSIKLFDTPSGIKSATLGLGLASSLELIYNEAEDIWEGDFIIPFYPFGKVQDYLYVSIMDNAGNELFTYLNDLRLFIFPDEVPDMTSPKGEIISEIPNEVQIGQTISFKANLSDSGSGVKGAKVYLYSKINLFDNNLFTKEIELQFDETENLWIGKYTVQQTDQPGRYQVSLEVEDKALNYDYFDYNQTILFKGTYYESPYYQDALTNFNNKDYYKAVYFAGEAIKDGDIRPVVQELMDKVAQALLDAAEKMTITNAKKAYQLLIDTVGVPEPIKNAAKAKLASLTDDNNDPDPDQGSNSNNNNDDRTDKTPPVNNDSSTNPLPATATNSYNNMIAGLALIIIGGIGVIVNKKKRIKR